MRPHMLIHAGTSGEYTRSSVKQFTIIKRGSGFWAEPEGMFIGRSMVDRPHLGDEVLLIDVWS